MTQIADTALANSSLRIDQRLARWILMIQDRLRTSSIAVTHQRLSDLLGVRRSGVTDAVHLLEESHMIRARRGMLDVLDRPQLKNLAAGCYGKPEAAHERLILGSSVNEPDAPDRDPA
jgi:DNA-binding transcriptional MocR family regulator